jgi:hypothetical protein
MLSDISDLLSIKPSPSSISSLISTTPSSLYNTVHSYYRIKYKIFLSSNIESDDILGLSLVMYCDINNINIPDRIIDYYFHVLVNNRMKDEDIMRSIQEENDIYKEKIDVESEIVKDAWYEMCNKGNIF